jgi:hypothetical protein
MRQTQIAKPVRKEVVRELDLRTPSGRAIPF